MFDEPVNQSVIIERRKHFDLFSLESWHHFCIDANLVVKIIFRFQTVDYGIVFAAFDFALVHLSNIPDILSNIPETLVISYVYICFVFIGALCGQNLLPTTQHKMPMRKYHIIYYACQAHTDRG